MQLNLHILLATFVFLHFIASIVPQRVPHGKYQRVGLVQVVAIIETMWLIFERTKLFVEPSAAAGLAPILFDKYKLPINSKAMFILCGGNIDKEKLIQISN